MKRHKLTRTEKLLFLAPVLALAAFAGAVWFKNNIAAVPTRMMMVYRGNINSVAPLSNFHMVNGQRRARWVNTGVSAIYTQAFDVTFEGHSSGSIRSDDYQVDGRPFMPGNWPEPEWTGDLSDSFRTKYSPRKRLFSIRFKGHQLDYSHHLQTLTVKGKTYSTANGPVHLLIKKNGQVVPKNP